MGAEDKATTDKVKHFLLARPVWRRKGTTLCAAMELPRLARPKGVETHAVYLYEGCVLD